MRGREVGEELDHFVLLVMNAERTADEVERVDDFFSLQAAPDLLERGVVDVADAAVGVGPFLSAQVHRSVGIDDGLQGLHVALGIPADLECLPMKEPIHDVDVEQVVRKCQRPLDFREHFAVPLFGDGDSRIRLQLDVVRSRAFDELGTLVHFGDVAVVDKHTRPDGTWPLGGGEVVEVFDDRVEIVQPVKCGMCFGGGRVEAEPHVSRGLLQATGLFADYQRAVGHNPARDPVIGGPLDGIDGFGVHHWLATADEQNRPGSEFMKLVDQLHQSLVRNSLATTRLVHRVVDAKAAVVVTGVRRIDFHASRERIFALAITFECLFVEQ